MKADSYHDPTYESMDNDHSDEYVVETLGSRAELRGGELCSTLRCPSPSCEAGLLPPSMQVEGTVSKQVQKARGHQQGRRRRRRERRCRLTQPTCPLR